MGVVTLVFFVAAALALAGSIGIIVSRDPIRSVLSLVLVMVALSALFLLLSAQFIFAVQIIVYAGAVMVLFLFVIALLGPVREAVTTRLRGQGWVAIAVAAAMAGLIAAMLGGSVRYVAPTKIDLATFGSVEDIAFGLLTTYLYPFELTSLLLLVAAVGAIYLSRREREE